MNNKKNENMYNPTHNTSYSKCNDIIFAQATVKGKAGLMVFRISGKGTINLLKKFCNYQKSWVPRKLYLTNICNPQTNELIDKAIIIFFQKNNSFTGEEVVELHLHGSIAIAKLLTEALLETKETRVAEPGEFIKRAFLNGKMDLTEIEGVADLIDAETKIQHQFAIKQATGSLKRLYQNWKNKLLQIMSLLEAYLDFSDEEVPNTVIQDANNIVQDLIQAIENHIKDYRFGERLRHGIKTVILGKPNVGKSTLFNYLAKREAAIVSNIAGTTRDILEIHLDIGGYPILLMDTAGLRKNTNDIIEKEGVERSKKAAEIADIIILVMDSLDDIVTISNKNIIYVLNKIDLYNDFNTTTGLDIVKISLKNNIGIEILLQKILCIAENSITNNDTAILNTRYRHSLKMALQYLQNFSKQKDLVLAIEDIKNVINSLKIITGEINVEDVLDKIFSNFCIGK